MKKSTLSIKSFYFFLLIGLAILIGFRQIMDVDVWWHMVFGREMLKTFHAPDLSLFYFPDVTHQVVDFRYTFLGDILLYLFYALGDSWGLQILRLILMSVAAWFVWDMCGKEKRALGFSAVLFFFILSYQLQVIRNALFSLPFFTAEIWLWQRFRMPQGGWVWKKHGWIMVALLTIWSFVHGSFILGFVLFSLLLTGDTVEYLKKWGMAPKKNTKKGKKKKETSELPDTFEEEFDSWRWSIVMLLGSFLGIFLFNKYVSHLLDRFVGSNWWLIVLFMVSAFFLIGWYRPFNASVRKYSRWVYRVSLAGCILGLSVFLIWLIQSGIHNSSSMALVDLRNPNSVAQTQDSSFFNGVKNTLNDLIFEQTDKFVISTDFQSPFDSFGEVYIYTTFLAALVIIVLMIWSRSLPFGLVFAFVPFFFLGASYKRAVGYLGILSLMILIHFFKENGKVVKDSYVWLTNGLLTVAIGFCLFTSPVALGFWANHVFAPGPSTYFSAECAQFLLENHPGERTFSTITNGGFLLSKWFPTKKVFVDGFFAPHKGKPFNVYQRTLIENDPDLLFRTFNIQNAIVTHRDLAWMAVFSSSVHWMPVAMDEGMVLFSRNIDHQQFVTPHVYFDLKRWQAIPFYFKSFVANRLFEIPATLVVKGFPEQAESFLASYRDLIDAAKPFADPLTVGQLQRNLEFAEEKYGGKNDPGILVEFQFQNAVQRKDDENVIQYGSSLWKNEHDVSLGFQLAQSYVNLNELSKAKVILSQTQDLSETDVEDWGRFRTQIYGLWEQIATKEEAEESYLQAFFALVQSQKVLPEKVSTTDLMRIGLNYVQAMQKAGEPLGAQDLLMSLVKTLPESPYIFHNLSYHILEHYQTLNLPLEKALDYELKAVKLAETEKNFPDQDILYKNLSDIYLAMGRKNEADSALSKARALAPPQRQSMYP